MSKLDLWDTPAPTERRITIGAKPSVSDYDLVRKALEDLVDALRFESRDEKDRIVITYLVPRQAEVSYSEALKILIKTPSAQSIVTKP